MNVKGKVAIVTGASRKIGKKIAETFAREGMKVVIASAHADKAKDAREEIGGDTIDIACDISREGDVKKLVQRTIEAFGEINVLVNNASIIISKSLLDMSSEEFNRVIEVDLLGTFLCTKYVVEVMVKQGKGGTIINIASTLGHRGVVENVAYCAAKGAVLNMTRQLAVELAQYGIAVNSVSPGKIGAPVGKESGAEKRSTGRIPMGRVGKPEDIANAVLFLVSDQVEYITGIDLPVDGGSLATSE